ncbi:uncharacterized protein Z518_06395 [Rhinocladiella mackenziei CBS 650.93]|uniref:Xylanolytic transcriptional activator regulatory domain-containing protein n=1 Tax=Rhinocladiella mackenziei CBS 650.93 TaxID=1442369 RepID=A0A0D2H558_9EURO|nr:uncharacterized protein Z518_06395 [Rhinocladiella mackenziei CBS 650.93]KIX05523.1 hypothetical protein Z518_06395 [Rhinocladiella mackenziei CBS 650.93]
MELRTRQEQRQHSNNTSVNRIESQIPAVIETPGSPLLPSKFEAQELIRSYFSTLYPLPSYAFLHESSISQRHAEGTLDECLTLAICVITAVHLNLVKFFPLLSSRWIQRVEDMVWQQLENPSVLKLQALLLVVRYHIHTGAFQRAFMLAALAARGATGLRLNYARSDLSFLAQEIRRRLVWTFSMLDGLFSIGLPEFELCPIEAIHLQLPCRENDLASPSPVETEPVRPGNARNTKNLGLYALYIRSTFMRRNIMKFSRQTAQEKLHASDFLVRFEQLEQEINDMETESKRVTTYSPPELGNYVGIRWLARYLMVHLSWHQCRCDLYRLFLPGYRDAAPAHVLQHIESTFLANGAFQCWIHANAIIDILADVDQKCIGQVFLEFDTAVVAYHAARLVLFLKRNDSLELDFAITRAGLCVAVVKSTDYASPSTTLTSGRGIGNVPRLETMPPALRSLDQRDTDVTADYRASRNVPLDRHPQVRLEAHCSTTATAENNLNIGRSTRIADE